MKLKRFNEKNLNLGELDRKSKTGETKGQKLVDRLKGDQNFTIDIKNEPIKQVNFDNNDDVVDAITIGDDKYDSQKAKNFFTKISKYMPVLSGEDENLYKLNDIKKDDYFGSSAGSSLGIEQTRIVESIQCLFLALKQVYPLKELSPIDINFLYDGKGNIDSKVMKYVRIPIQVDEYFIKSFFENDKKNWISTFVNTANSLYVDDLQLVNKQRTVFKSQRKYNFHQIGCESELIKSINLAYDLSGIDGIPISKWTPSDVWAVDATLEKKIISEIRNCSNIKELNNVINARFLKSQLVGVSLKKIGGSETISLVINQLTPTPNYYFDKIITSKDPFGSMGVKLVVRFESEIIKSGKATMYLRSFQGADKISNISGEVEGSFSRYGKIGLEWINYILSDRGVLNDDLIPTKIKILKYSEKYTDEFIRAEIIRMNALFKETSISTKKIIDDVGSTVSKYQALRFGELIQQLSEAEFIDESEDDEIETARVTIADKVVEDMFYYALAIKNFQFDCPMYVRIISDKS